MSQELKDKQYLTLNEAAGILRVHRDTAARFIRSGKIPGFKIGRGYRIPKADFEIAIRKNDAWNSKGL